MKKICLLAFLCAGIMAFSGHGLCQDATKGPAKQQRTPVTGIKHRTTVSSRAGSFSGSVIWADPVSKTITVKGRGKIVTFDASNPTLRGYRRLEDIREGSYVSVSYTASGVRVSRISRSEVAAVAASESRGPVRAGKKEPKKRMARIHQKGIGFHDVDENKDGRVTAVELSVVMGGLTIEQFRQFDRNGDGCLSETEYRAALRSR